MAPTKGLLSSLRTYLVAKMVVIVTSDRKLGDFTLFRGRIATNLQGLVIVITQLIIRQPNYHGPPSRDC